MTFKFEGKNPAQPPYIEVGSVGVFDNVSWSVFSRPGPNDATTLQLVAQGRAPNKANYRDMVWNGSELKDNKQVELMRDHRNELYVSFLEFLASHIPLDSDLLTSTRGRTRAGSNPTALEWGLVGCVTQAGIPWNVYCRTLEYKAAWVPIKVVAQTPAPMKANYHLKWNSMRFAGERESELLAQYRPDLHAEVMRLLRGAKISGKKETVQQVSKVEEKITIQSVYAKVAKLREREKGKGREHTNLGGVGLINRRERDLLIYEIPEHPDYLEVRLTADEKRTSATDSYFVVRAIDNGGLEIFGELDTVIRKYNPEAWPRVEELLKQYFLEKELYADIDNGEQAE